MTLSQKLFRIARKIETAYKSDIEKEYEEITKQYEMILDSGELGKKKLDTLMMRIKKFLSGEYKGSLMTVGATRMFKLLKKWKSE